MSTAPSPVSSTSWLRPSRHSLKQLKFVLPGGLATYLLDTINRILELLLDGRAGHGQKVSGWTRSFAQVSVASGILTVGLFLYILLLPWFRGVQPNYSKWRQSGDLSIVIPLLTFLILSGWLLLSITLGRGTDLGYVKGVMASSGLYALIFGLLGLIPAPMIKRH